MLYYISVLFGKMSIKGFFDNVSHDKLMGFVKIRVKDSSLLHLIERFLKAGYVDNGVLIDTEKGTPQGSILSPMLANIFLHYVLDKWFEDTCLGCQRNTNIEDSRSSCSPRSTGCLSPTCSDRDCCPRCATCISRRRHTSSTPPSRDCLSFGSTARGRRSPATRAPTC